MIFRKTVEQILHLVSETSMMEINAIVKKLDNGFILEAFGETTAIETSVSVVSTLGEKLNSTIKNMKEGDAMQVSIVCNAVTDSSSAF